MLKTLSLLCLTATLATAQVKFSPTAYGANQSPNSVITGDFNLDGKPDFAVMESGNQLTIFLNKGTSGFAQKAQYAIVTNNNDTRIDTADVNGDGILDILIGKQFIPEFEIWYGNGDGTFRFGKDVPIDSGDSLNFALGDANRDGHVDFLYQYNDDTSSFVAVYLNDGAANFNSVGGPVFPTFVDNWALADFDRDGNLDILARMGSTLQEYSNDGTGRFLLHKTSTVNGGTGAMTVGSFNHDAVPDIALLIRSCDAGTCTSSTHDKAYVYLNDGTGHFGLRSSYTAGIGFGNVTAGDLNGDTIGDIIATGADTVTGNAVLCNISSTRARGSSTDLIPPAITRGRLCLSCVISIWMAVTTWSSPPEAPIRCSTRTLRSHVPRQLPEHSTRVSVDQPTMPPSRRHLQSLLPETHRLACRALNSGLTARSRPRC